MKANCVNSIINITPKAPVFRSETAVMPVIKTEQDEFVSENKKKPKNTVLKTIAGLTLIGVGGFLTFKAFSRNSVKGKIDDIKNNITFKKVEEAKEYFEKLGIETDFRGATDEHLPMLNRIKDNLSKIKEMGVKIQKPDSITISDWKNASEYEELIRKKGIDIERREDFWAFCSGKNDENHIFINSNKAFFDKFIHEMGHANHFKGFDSYWHSKGLTQHDFADKQLEILGSSDKVYRDGRVHGLNLSNILRLSENQSPSKFVFPNAERETRYVTVQNAVDKMQSETNCYDGGKHIHEQVADVFEGLLQGKTFSDETMLYYDFAGGARIPNLKIEGKNYDDYIESLYNNSELIQKLRENIKISKI